uniref:Transmembrane protein 174 n=1 Tax=Oncorhynchus kisutch TaxID=8019 RepID=A0A8C7JMX7_ONCKI
EFATSGRLDSHVSVSDGEKTGATLLFSGIFLDLVGMTFKVMGWLKYNVNRSFEWTQLLDPILLSVGGTFILISVCMFRILSCRFSESLTIPGSCQSIVFNGINQPIMFHKATVVQYIPSPYGFVTQEVNPEMENWVCCTLENVTCCFFGVHRGAFINDGLFTEERVSSGLHKGVRQRCPCFSKPFFFYNS